MTRFPALPPRRVPAVLGLVLALAGSSLACGAKAPLLPVTGQLEADRFLYERGADALKRRKWLEAREYFRRLVDTYPQSAHRADAKLGIGDAYLGEGRSDSLVLGANEFREFLTFFPLNPRVDYAQYRLALTQVRQVLSPQRDQTATREALVELSRFLQAYPDSGYRAEVAKLHRQMRDRLSESDFRVGLFYFRSKWLAGALDRFRSLLADDPDYTARDGVYFYLAEALLVLNARAEALPYYERLAAEFPKSQYLTRTTKRIGELKAAPITR
jgi:outer membrane protein assembly factor BamD